MAFVSKKRGTDYGTNIHIFTSIGIIERELRHLIQLLSHITTNPQHFNQHHLKFLDNMLTILCFHFLLLQKYLT